MNKEANLIMGLVGTALALLVAFGVHMTAPQTDSILKLAAAVLAVIPLFATAVARGFVYSKKTVDQIKANGCKE